MNDWFNDDTGIELADVRMLVARIGDRAWDNLIHLNGIVSGTWRPMPYNSDNPVVQVLRLYKSREEFRAGEGV